MHVLATAGHVDHGKSTLVRAVTGMEPDRWEAERRRGLTIDLGFAWTTVDNETLAFVDVPGHERFVQNMLAGIGPVPAVLFVVAADSGWMPQSTEHLAALDALDVRRGLVAITRTDLGDPAPVEDEVRDRLAGTSLADSPFVRVSAPTGTGMRSLRDGLLDLVRELPAPDQDADVRLWVDRGFTVRGAGTVVTGTLSAGRLHVADEFVVHRTGQRVSVRGLQTLGTDRTEVGAVARVAVNLRGVHVDDIGRGDALVTPGHWLGTDLVDVRLRGCPSAELPGRLTVHVGSAAVPARVRPLDSEHVRLRLAAELPLRIGDRALLRDPGQHRITAGFTVLDVRPPELHRRGAAPARGKTLAAASGAPDGAAELHARRVIRTAELHAMGADTPVDACAAGDWLLDRGHRDVLADRLREVVADHHERNPIAEGLPLEAARRALRLPSPALLAPVLEVANDVLRQDGVLRLRGCGLPPRLNRALDLLRDRLGAEPFDAPTAEELAALELGDRELAAADRVGAVLRLAPGVVLLPDAEEVAVRRLATLAGPFTLSQARRVWNTSRRVAVPLLERLARRGRTERVSATTHRLR